MIVWELYTHKHITQSRHAFSKHINGKRVNILIVCECMGSLLYILFYWETRYGTHA